MPGKHKNTSTHMGTYKTRLFKSLVIVLIALLGIYILLPQLYIFKDSMKAIFRADNALFGWALTLFIGSYFTAAASICLLAYFKLPYWRTLLVQIADGFTNRLLPAGIGAVATNALYLAKQNHKGAEASYLAGLNNILGFFGHVLLMLGLILFSKTPLRSLFIIHFTASWAAVAILILFFFLFGVLIFSSRLRSLTAKNLKAIKLVVSRSWHSPLRLMAALMFSMLTTLCYGLALYATSLALNVHVSLLGIFVALTSCIALKTITPTPGGVGGAEAGLVAAFASLGVPAGQGLSVALAYRALTYWLPIVPGFVAFQIALKKNYIALK